MHTMCMTYEFKYNNLIKVTSEEFLRETSIGFACFARIRALWQL